MYETFFGLRERPFDLTANLRFLFLTPKHREALSNLQYGVSHQKGLIVLTGDAGTGKTTIIRAALDSLDGENTCSVYLDNPTLTRGEFLEVLASGFGLNAEAATSKAKFLRELTASLLNRRAVNGKTALIIDEAQSLPDRLLEEVRLLANLETPQEKLLSVILAGQSELAARLDAPLMRQFKQRIAVRCQLAALDLRETAAYIAARIRSAGGDPANVFTRRSVELIYERSRGIPRTISVLCDNALVSGFARDTRPVTGEIVLEVCRDFAFGPETAVPPGMSDRAAETATLQPMPQPPVSDAAGPSADAPRERFKPTSRELFKSSNPRTGFPFFRRGTR